jgi:hypothetical protein
MITHSCVSCPNPPKAPRHTLAGAEWVGVERGERDGLVRASGEREREAYASGNGRRSDGQVEGEQEEWDVL